MTFDASAVLEALGLPPVSRTAVSVAEVAGGWSNAVRRVATPSGEYAVKELRNTWGEPRWLDWLAEGWRLERAALAAGIRAPEPVVAPGSDSCVVRVGGSAYRAHRWVEAATVARAPVGPRLAQWVGESLAVLHGLAVRPLQPSLYAGRAGLTTADHWPALLARATTAGVPWAADLEASVPLVRRASALLEPWDDADAVLVHGDVDQKNLLVTASGPLLIDWDVVLPAVPSHDLAHAAVTMGSWRDPAAARAVLDGYTGAAGPPPRLRPTDLGPALASRLGWIRFTADRALDAVQAGVPGEPPDVAGLLADLRHRVHIAEHLEAWLRG